MRTRQGQLKVHACVPAQGERTLADVLLVLPPYYLAGVTEAGIAAFLRVILQASKLPVFLYNFPANTNSLISPQLYADLAHEFPVLRGIKNTFEDTPLAKQFKEAAPQLQVRLAVVQPAAADARCKGCSKGQLCPPNTRAEV